MGPRCTPEIPGSRARTHFVSSCAAGSPEFRLSSQAYLCDWSGSKPRNGSALRYSRLSRLLMHNQVGSGWTPAEGALVIKYRPARASTPACSLTAATGWYNGSLSFVFATWHFFGLWKKRRFCLGPYHYFWNTCSCNRKCFSPSNYALGKQGFSEPTSRTHT